MVVKHQIAKLRIPSTELLTRHGEDLFFVEFIQFSYPKKNLLILNINRTGKEKIEEEKAVIDKPLRPSIAKPIISSSKQPVNLLFAIRISGI